jgi:hypothetical protein
MTREVPPGEWRAVLERFSCEHRAWLATIHIVDDRRIVSRFDQRRLRSAIATVDAMHLDFLDERRLCARRPCGLRIQQTETGLTQAMEIDTVDGRLIRIAFRATASPEQLDGVAPGELTACR